MAEEISLFLKLEVGTVNNLVDCKLVQEEMTSNSKLATVVGKVAQIVEAGLAYK